MPNRPVDAKSAATRPLPRLGKLHMRMLHVTETADRLTSTANPHYQRLRDDLG